MSRKSKALLVSILLAVSVSGKSSAVPSGPFDEFGDINCEDEMARLDNFAVALQNSPDAKGLIVIYGGRRFRGRLPKRGEDNARAARLKTYLVQRRGIPTDRVMVVNWGYTDEWHAQLWIVPHGATIPERQPTIPAKEIEFRKGRVNPRDYRCHI